MIYIGKVQPSIMEMPIDMDILEFFSTYKPQRIRLPENEEQLTKIKRTELNGLIAGKMKALIRKNINVVNRDCIIIDLDDVILSEQELISAIQQKFNKFDRILYPSISHGLKGVRYRLLVPLDKPVEENDYKLLIQFFSSKLLQGIILESDRSNLTWSQLQLLPALTQFVTMNQILIEQGERKFPVDEALIAAKNWLAHTDKTATRDIQDNLGKYKKGANRYRNTTTELFESIVAGGEIGNRNNRIAQLTGGLLARAVDVSAVLELVKIANEHFTEPLPVQEVETTFYSIAKKELGAN